MKGNDTLPHFLNLNRDQRCVVATFLGTPMDLDLICETVVNHEIEDEIVEPLWLIIVVVVRKEG